MPCMIHPEVQEGLNQCSRCRKLYCGDCLVELKGGFFCASCKAQEVKDIQSGVKEGKELVLASRWARLASAILDSLLGGAILVPLIFAFGLFNLERLQRDPESMQSKFQLLGLLGGGIFFVYEGLMLQLRGQTVGKIALGIRVVTTEGNPLSGWQAWVRPLVRTVMGAIPSGIGGLVNIVPILFTSQKTCIHDLAAKTRVVKVRT